MGFDDLASHMASRDRKRKLVTPSVDVDKILADAAVADRRMSRTRDLILGPLLLFGGLAILLLYGLYLRDATDTTSPVDPRNVDTSDGSAKIRIYYMIGLPVLAGGMVIVGSMQLLRGLRGRSR